MFSQRLRAPLQTAAICLSLCAVTPAQVPAPLMYSTANVKETGAPAQTPAPAPQNPAQQDATRPPGTQQQQPPPDQPRPNNDPTRPPSTQQPLPQAPPGTTLPPATQTPTQSTPPAPTATPLEGVPPTMLPETQEDTAVPVLTDTTPRPVPPMPSLTRLGVQGDNTLPLTLNEAIRRALENNNDIEIARNDVKFAETVLHSLQGVYDPVFQYTPQINNSVRPVTSIFGGANTAGTVGTTDINNDFALSKSFGRYGSNVSYFFNNTRETTTASSSTLNPFYSSNQGIQLTQPLWRNRKVDFNRRQIRIQRKRLEQSDADFRRSTINVISQVQRAYWDLVFALRDEQNQIANVNLARENFRRTEASVSAGASAPLERAEVQTELSNRISSLLSASQLVSVAENTLKQLILKDPLVPEWSAALVPTDKPSFDLSPVDLVAALTEARSARPELHRQKLQQEINDIDLSFYKNQTNPQIDLVATFSTTGLAGTVNPDVIARNPGLVVPAQFTGGYTKTLENLFKFSTRNIVVGATIQLPLHNTTAKANLAGAQVQRDQIAAQMRSEEQIIEVEVRNAAQSVETARQRVISAREARANAELQLTGERRLYQVGRSTTFILFQRENALVNARNQELRAETDYNKALAELQRATSTTLRANNIVVETPTMP
jgi:HAE1 family hydrophobic/amphiphilic exporter-1